MDKAKQYSCAKYTLSITETLYLVSLIFLFLKLGFSTSLAAVTNFPAYLLITFVLYYVLSFPLNFYHTFILEHKFNLSTQKFSSWLEDQLKAGVLGYVFSLISFGAFYLVLKNNPHTWWVIVSLVWIFFSLIIAKVFPVLIIPLFFKYKPLTDADLRRRIITLSEKMKVKILDVFEIDFSKKSLKANAAFVGWGRSRRVILADTLKDKYTGDEIAVILAHEFSHYRLKHLIKLILVSAASTFLAFYLIFKTSEAGLEFFSLSSLENTAALPLVFLYFILLGLITRPLENFLSRRFEKQADKEAIKVTGLKEAFISMMHKLGAQNLADCSPHQLIKFFFFDHPPISERITAAKCRES